jgi:lysozyme family protein
VANFDSAIDIIIKHEGSTYTETPGDRGGATKFGITIPTLTDFDGKPHDKEDIRTLTLKDAKAIYLKEFWNPMCLSAIHDQRLATIMLDQAVLNGKSGFTRRLQSIVGTMPDGIMGPQTAAACNSRNTNNLILDILAAQTKFYTSLVANNPPQIKFLKGWQNRVLALYDVAFKV